MHLLSLKNAFRARLPSKLHRQLLHQHHLQSHLQWGNDPRVANHNGIPSATHPPAPLATPFTMRERSYSCKSQWNSVDHTCTKNSGNPIYNAEPIREYPRMIRPHTRPSRTRRTAEVDHRRSGTDFVWKNIGFRASAISQKRISCEISSKTPSATPPLWDRRGLRHLVNVVISYLSFGQVMAMLVKWWLSDQNLGGTYYWLRLLISVVCAKCWLLSDHLAIT